MVFQAAPQGVEVKLISDQNGVPVVNVWNIDVGHAVTYSDLTGAFAVFDAWLTSDYAPLIQPSVVFQQWIITDISVANGQQVIYTPTTANGTASGSQSAANAAFVASLRTAHTGRSYRGRTYVPGIPSTAFADAQHITPTYAANVNTAFANLISALTTAGSKLVVLSRYLNNALRVVALLTEVISVVTDTKVDSQRRRTAN